MKEFIKLNENKKLILFSLLGLLGVGIALGGKNKGNSVSIEVGGRYLDPDEAHIFNNHYKLARDSMGIKDEETAVRFALGAVPPKLNRDGGLTKTEEIR